jgi:hypothetical protein
VHGAWPVHGARDEAQHLALPFINGTRGGQNVRHPRTTPGFTVPAGHQSSSWSRARTVMHRYPDPLQSQPSKWCRTSRSRAVSASSARYKISVSLMRRSLGPSAVQLRSHSVSTVDGCFPTMLTSSRDDTASELPQHGLGRLQQSMRPCAPCVLPQHHDHDQDARDAPIVGPNTRGLPSGATFATRRSA